MPSERAHGILSDILNHIDLAAEFIMKARHPQIAWRQMAAAGNVYRHDYEDVLAQLVWDTVQTALPR